MRKGFFRQKLAGDEMSVYFIATDREKAAQAENELRELYGRPADTYACGPAYITISSAYRENYTMRSFDEGRIYIIGTIFDACGFDQELLDRFESYQEFVSALRDKKQKFFGHYVAICAHADRQCAEIIQDRVGLINTYYARTADGGYCCSNDIVLTAKYSGNHILCTQGVHEFILLEANVGTQTIFAGVSRMKLGNGLLLQENSITERQIYDYRIEKMSVEQYLDRIQEYFVCFRNYQGKVVADVSGGYDTRLILSIAHRYLQDLVGFSAENRGDGGIDEELSRIIIDRLNVEGYFMKSYSFVEVTERDKELVLHGSSAMRDSNNSCKWGHLFRERYSCGGLVLGGYGGEVLRAKYNRYSDLDDFVRQYYKGEEAEKICKFDNFTENIKKGLQECIVPEELNPECIQNWYYAVVQMRIWGSGFIQMSDLYGDVVHPFMDWYLLGPIFGFEQGKLEHAKLQKYIIDHYAPVLKDVPVNCHMGKKPSVKARLKDLIHHHKSIRNIGTLTYCRLRNLRQNKTEGFELTEYPACDQPMDWERIMKKSGKAVRSRMQSVVRALSLTRQGDSL